MAETFFLLSEIMILFLCSHSFSYLLQSFFPRLSTFFFHVTVLLIARSHTKLIASGLILCLYKIRSILIIEFILMNHT